MSIARAVGRTSISHRCEVALQHCAASGFDGNSDMRTFASELAGVHWLSAETDTSPVGPRNWEWPAGPCGRQIHLNDGGRKGYFKGIRMQKWNLLSSVVASPAGL